MEHPLNCQRPDIFKSAGYNSCLNCGATYYDTNSILQTNHSTRSDSEAELSDEDDIINFEHHETIFSAFEEEDGDYDADFLLEGEFESDHYGLEILANSKQYLSAAGSRAPHFVYKRINQKEELRLLRIQQTTDVDSPIQCTITHETLHQVLPPFEAISYTWADESGDSAKKATIYLDSKPFTVTANCERALRRVRLKGQSRLVWIDAICIDQDSEAEKTHQVQLMAQIYARANRVLIYVGEASEQSTQLLEILGNPLHTDRDCEAILKRDHLEKALSVFLSRPYFWRVWVLQEIALAKQAILICGGKSIAWRVLAGRKLVDTHSNLRPAHLLSKPNILRALETFQSHHGGCLTSLPPALGFQNPTLRDVAQLLPLLEIASFCDASDPRDKVYALLGLVTGLEPLGFIPDYTETVEDVYVDIAVLLARECGPMALLTKAVCRPSISRRRPWVPDWRHAPNHVPPQEPYEKMMKAIQATLPKPKGDSSSTYKSPPTLPLQDTLHIRLAAVCSMHDILSGEHPGLDIQCLKMAILPADGASPIELDIYPKHQPQHFKSLKIAASPLASDELLNWIKTLRLYSPWPTAGTLQTAQRESSRVDILHSQCLVMLDCPANSVPSASQSASNSSSSKGTSSATPNSTASNASAMFRGLCTLSFLIKTPRPTHWFWYNKGFLGSGSGTQAVYSLGWQKKCGFPLDVLRELTTKPAAPPAGVYGYVAPTPTAG